jgi:hypothetical protein
MTKPGNIKPYENFDFEKRENSDLIDVDEAAEGLPYF